MTLWQFLLLDTESSKRQYAPHDEFDAGLTNEPLSNRKGLKIVNYEKFIVHVFWLSITIVR
jgi:hypothetical protein